MWRAWVNRADGSLARIFVDGEPTPEYSEKTHDLITLDDTQLADAKAGKLWSGGLMVDAPLEPAKTQAEIAAEDKQMKQAAAEAYLARIPDGVIDLIAERVAKNLKP